MPIHTNSIGIHTFEDLKGNVQKRGEQLQRFVRPGIDGAGYRMTGARTNPFSLISVHYVLSHTAAKDALEAYQLLIDQDPVVLIQNSVNHGTYKVLSVQQISSFAVTASVGTLIADAEVLQRCRWTLEG